MKKTNIYKKISILVLVLFTFLLIPNSKVKAFDLSSYPVGICVTFYDGIDSRGFAWQTSKDVTETHLLIAKDNGGSINWANVTPIKGTYVDSYEDYRCHKAYKEDLEPGKYYYKVGSPNAYSEVGSFVVDNSNDNKFSFGYLTDSQDETMERFEAGYGKTLRALNKYNPNFLMFAGDLVNNSYGTWDERPETYKMDEWVYAFDCAKEVIMNTTFMSAAGNHEGNGYTFVNHSTINYAGTSNSGAYYSFDYENAHFVILNTNLYARTDGQALIPAQEKWLEEDLASTDKTWKVVMLHGGPYSTGDHTNDGDILTIRNTLPQIFAKYKVDLVLQGHDHVYTRTMPYLYGVNSLGEQENGRVPNRNEKLVEEDGILWSMEPDGTYYITINTAGFKTYPPDDYDTSRIFPAKSPINGKYMSQYMKDLRMFANVEIDGDTLLLKSYISHDNGTDELYDYIAVKKNTYKAAIEAVDKLPDTVTIDDSHNLKAAYDLVMGLSARALAYVPQNTIDKLNRLMDTYNVDDAVKAYDAILAIAKLNTTTYDEAFWINYQTANDLYYNLNASQMEMVYNKDILSELKVNLEEYRDETIQKYLVESVQELIDKIMTQPNKEKARIIAKMAYDALSSDLKARITNAEILNQSFVPVEGETPSESNGGCGGAITASLTTILALGLSVLVIKRRRGEYDE